MNILHVATAFKRDKADIITPWMVELLCEQSRRHNVYVLTSGYRRIPSRQHFRDIDIIRFNYSPSYLQKMTHDSTIAGFIRQHPLYIFLLPLFFITGAYRLYRTVRIEQIDIINVHWPFPLGLMTVPVYLLTDIPIVFTWYGAEFKVAGSSKLIRLLIKGLSRIASRHIAISSSTADLLQNSTGTENITVIPYGIKIPPKKHYRKDKFILFAGRLVERKGVEYLIKAMEFIDSEYQLKIAGNGPLLAHLASISDEMDLSERVQFLGFVSDKELKDLYRRASVFVLPAVHDRRGDTEGLGMVLVEAMRYKTPVIATGIGGIVDIVHNNRTGLYSDERDPADIAEKIKMLIENKQLYDNLTENAYCFIEEKFSLGSVTQKYEKVYEEI
ncbi:MAG: glycosyltransferase family 4 protein [candidate division WOR-3 bacterium]|nr:glycosyltransferase family 4 protein [candidate division WOR-3 bacterium]